MKKKIKRGFTIVELVIVIAVIGVLAAILIPTFAGLINTANEAADTKMVKNLNTALAADEVLNGKHTTAYDAIKVANETGYSVEKLTPTANGCDIVWDKTTDRFVIMKGDVVKFCDETRKPSTNKYDMFKIYKREDIPAEQTYSIYLMKTDDTSPVNINGVGIDVGDNTSITQITYNNSISDVDVVIRTNSANTTLTISDDTNGKISHYDSLGKVIITKCDYNCYYEYGITAYAEVTEGKVVAKTGGEIKVLYATTNTVAAKVDGGSIGEAYCVHSSEITGESYTAFSNEKDGNVTFEFKDSNDVYYTQEAIEEKGSKAIDEAIVEENKNKFPVGVAIATIDDLKAFADGSLEGLAAAESMAFLVKDITFADNDHVTFSNPSSNLTLNLYGHSITGNWKGVRASETEGLFNIVAGSLTIDDTIGTGLIENVNKANSNNLTNASVSADGLSTIAVFKKAHLTIKGGTIKNEQNNTAAILVHTDTAAAEDNISLTVEGGKIIGMYAGISDNGANYLTVGATVVKGGSISGYYGIEKLAGNLEISGGTIKGDYVGLYINGKCYENEYCAISGGLISGAACVYIGNSQGKHKVNFNIDGGTFESKGKYCIYNIASLTENELHLSSGTFKAKTNIFNNEESIDKYLVSGKSITGSDGEWIVK